MAIIKQIGLSLWRGTKLKLNEIEEFFRRIELKINEQINTIKYKEEVMDEAIKAEKIREYKTIFLQDKSLGKIFTKDELDRKISKDIKVFKFFEQKGTGGDYNIRTKKIRINRNQEDFFETVTYHEITHGVFTHNILRTGLELVLKVGNDEEYIVKGTGLNEGATEYIAKKITKKTNYNNMIFYYNNVQIIKMLCMAYGEELIFRALKEGPEILAKRLERDGISYNELLEATDEMQNAFAKDRPKEETDPLVERALGIAQTVLNKKYEKSNLKEKIEIAKRMREISEEQSVSKNIHYEERSVFEKINQEMYNEYIKNRNVLEIPNKEIAKAILKFIFEERWDVNLEDIDNVQVNTVKNSKEEIMAYVANLRENVVDVIYKEKDNKLNRVDMYKADAFIYGNRDNRTYDKYKVEAEKYGAFDKSILVGYDRNIQDFTSMIINEDGRIKFLKNNEGKNSFDELKVEKLFKLGEIFTVKSNETNKLKNIIQKIVKPRYKMLSENAFDYKKTSTKTDFAQKYKIKTKNTTKYSKTTEQVKEEHER